MSRIPVTALGIFATGMTALAWKTSVPLVLAGARHETAIIQQPKTLQPPLAASREATRPELDYEKLLELTWKTVRDHFYDREMNGVDWNQVEANYRLKLAGIKTQGRFAALINQMLGELHASHTAYYTDQEIEFSLLPSVMRGDLRGHRVEQIGVLGGRIGGEYQVSAVIDGSPAQVAGIQSGDRLLSVDGVSFTTVGSFEGKAGQSAAITLRREGQEKPLSVRVTAVKQNVLRALLEATQRSARVLKLEGKRVGYVHLWTMGNDAFRQALREIVLNRLHDTDALILDLRDGYGGTPWGYADLFFVPDIAWEGRTHDHRPNVSYTGYDRPLVTLINGGTRSSKEFFAYQLKVTHRSTLVGSKTTSAFLGADVFPIGKHGLLELAVEGLKVDGKPLEGAGVAPDVEVGPHLSYTTHDSQMFQAERTALALIRQTESSRLKPALRQIHQGDEGPSGRSSSDGAVATSSEAGRTSDSVGAAGGVAARR